MQLAAFKILTISFGFMENTFLKAFENKKNTFTNSQPSVDTKKPKTQYKRNQL